MPTFKHGDTYYSTYQAQTKHHIYRPGLVTVIDPSTAWQAAPSPDHELVQFQPYGKRKDYHWIDSQYLREAEASDFTVGDIIVDNTLSVANCEIIEIDSQTSFSLRSMMSNGPIKAELLDELGLRTGTVFHLEPCECIMVEPLSEPTLDLFLQESDIEPRNNDGRKRCYWCRGKLKKVPGFNMDVYDICIECGR